MASSITSAQPSVVATPAAPPAAPASAPSPQAKRDAAPAAPQRVEGKELDVEGLRKAALAVATGKAAPPADGEATATPAGEVKPTPPKPKEPGKEGEEEEAPTPPADLTQKKLSEGFAKLAAQEKRDKKRFEERMTEISTKAADITSREQAIAAREKAAAEYTNDPLALLAAHGWDFDRVVQYVTSDGKVPPEVLAQKASDATKKQLEEQQKKLDAIEKQRQEHEDALLSSEWERRSYAGVESKLGKPDAPLQGVQIEIGGKSYGIPTVEWIDSTSGRGTVFADVLKVQGQHFQRTGQTLDPVVALVHVEQAYARMFPNLQARNPAQQGAGTPAATGAEKPRQITSSDVSDVSVPTDEELDKMTPDERRARAVSIAKGSRR